MKAALSRGWITLLGKLMDTTLAGLITVFKCGVSHALFRTFSIFLAVWDLHWIAFVNAQRVCLANRLCCDVAPPAFLHGA